jgi:hypothetical protein
MMIHFSDHSISLIVIAAMAHHIKAIARIQRESARWSGRSVGMDFLSHCVGMTAADAVRASGRPLDPSLLVAPSARIDRLLGCMAEDQQEGCGEGEVDGEDHANSS